MKSSSISHRLKGFTILELLVGMIATSIVIAAVFSAYHIISVQSASYQDKSKSITELSLFHSRVMQDFHEASFVKCAEDELVLNVGLDLNQTNSASPGSSSINYEFHEGYTLRTIGEHTDTFFVAVHSCKAILHGETIINPEVNLGQVRLTLGENNEQVVLRKSIDAKSELLQEEEEWMQ